MSKFKEWEPTKNIFIQFRAEIKSLGVLYDSYSFKKLTRKCNPIIKIKNNSTQEISKCNILTREVLNQFIVGNQQ